VRQLGSVARLEVREQVEFAAIVGAVAAAIQRNDALRSVAAAERARHQVRRVDGPPAADEAMLAGDLVAQHLRRRDEGCAPHPRPPHESPRPVRRRTFERSSIAGSLGADCGSRSADRPVRSSRLVCACPIGTPISSASSLSSKPTSGLKSPAGISNSRAHRSARAWSKVRQSGRLDLERVQRKAQAKPTSGAVHSEVVRDQRTSS
jgi:hypothetical protein